ncbi:heavy metal translocating P-type ATPase [Alterisphingorhabdus coralli]|uniref:Heavy metal translocating P-type ATPase n=1 Tax=Alterisphingorhabdus coralli TaxID=3071408 RepID=A0AA97I0T4_9SPHN|nr:heavy metal translocating P-type ATPase [Parasphingorhabdus sp. SCSIO 66989]WOE75332.1 heavy metal translocating P-type ATPase [Parasphingorhabdus sp. SCSIO 66989]
MNAAYAPVSVDDAAACEDSRFAVPAIRCAGCISKIERGLNAVPGVAAARVNFSSKQVAISHDPALSEADLLRAIEDIGFEAQILADNPLAEEKGSSKALLRALAVAGFGMMNIMLLSVSIWSGADGDTRALFHWLSALIAIPVIAYSGRPFFASALMALKHARTNMDVPISIGILLATGLSLYETATDGPHAYFDGVVMLLFFLLAGRALDGMMRDKARSGIAALLGKSAPGAMVVQPDGTTAWTKARDIQPGMTMQLAAGERLAADGVIDQGASGFDMAMLTGESDPQNKGKGDAVYAGTVNLTAPVRVRVTASGNDTSIADIARLMDEAGQHRSFHVRIADKAARYYAPAVHSLALLSFTGWMIAGAGVHQSLLIAVAVLIITCPCALGLAVPAAQVVAAGALMKRGVLVKDGSALERLATANHVIFDKTGTLTLGRPRPGSIDHLSPEEKSVALALAQASRHPLSKGLREALLAEKLTPAEINEPNEIAGEGMRALWQGQEVRLGKGDAQSEGLAVTLSIGAEAKLIRFTDPLRPDADTALAALADKGMTASILSGDTLDAVAPVARQLGLTAQAGASPQDKLETIDRLSSTGRNILMVGDGLNDGPALAAAHVSMAPGSASDVGQQAADAVFTGDSLMGPALAVHMARRTMAIVQQNFALAIGYNVLAVPLAISGMVTPLVAAVAMSLSSLIVVGNALRLSRALPSDHNEDTNEPSLATMPNMQAAPA